ncbi:toxin [Escherichia coli]|nr:TA system toxin CbtA family protein [Escherichia coli]MCQ1630304.1 toxin [Escherichia coli]MXD21870.1 hypothetical protein [Escherichia coli]
MQAQPEPDRRGTRPCPSPSNIRQTLLTYLLEQH